MGTNKRTILALIPVGLLMTGVGIADSAGSPEVLPAAVTDADYRDGGVRDREKVALGQLLFFDKVLSGNRNIACATCHHPSFGTSDGLPLGLGEGATGLGPDRSVGSTVDAGVHDRIPRNSPALFNLGAEEFTVLFHDGRVEADRNGYYDGGFVTPARWKLPVGLESELAAQAMFPVGSPAEMAGQKGENPIADAAALNRMAGPTGVWALLAERLQGIPEYVDRFRRAFPGEVQAAGDITYVLAANAIAAFESDAFRSDGSPFDRYLRGEAEALEAHERRGMELFYGKAGCGGCHSGKFQTDHSFHAIAMPQIGPGKGDGADGDYWRSTGERAFLEDLGRGRVTVRPEDAFGFRTPSLRNVELTGPWGHAGAYLSLEDVVRHHLDPVESLERYTFDTRILPELPGVLELTVDGSRLSQAWLSDRRKEDFLRRDGWIQGHPRLRGRIAEANELDPVTLTDAEVADLVAFLRSLTDPAARDLSHVIPERVPSGLPVER